MRGLERESPWGLFGHVTRWLFLLLIVIANDVTPRQIDFITKPNSLEYITCGQDAVLNWTYDASRTFTKISWYKLQDDGVTIDDRFASRGGSTQPFTINSNSKFLPAREGRIEYLGSSVLKIKNVDVRDAGFVSCKAIFGLDHAESTTQLKILTPPRANGPELTGHQTANISDASKTFTCNVTSQPRANITWINSKGEAIAVQNSRYRITRSNVPTTCQDTIALSELTIFNISQTDAGNITCQAAIYTEQTFVLNQTVKFIVQYPPGGSASTSTFFNITSQRANGTLHANFICQSSSIPASNYKILKDGEILATSSPPSGTPIMYAMEDVRFYDHGIYVCQICNIFTCVNVNQTLNVTTPVTIWYTPNSIHEVNTDESFNISCGFYGQPLKELDVNWTKLNNQSELLTQTKLISFRNASITYMENSLLFGMVVARNYGLYRCYASNAFGTVHSDVTIYVRSSPKVLTSYPSSIETHFTEYQRVEYNCTAAGYPKPSITWKLNSDVISASSENYTHPLNNNGTWRVVSRLSLNMTRSKAGLLQCIASNGYLNDANVSSQLIVKHLPSISIVTHGYTRITANTTDAVILKYNNTVTLNCMVSGYPKSNVTWTKNGARISANRTTETTTRSLHTVMSVVEIARATYAQNNDVYTCVANSSLYGHSEATIMILIASGEFLKRPNNPLYASVGQSVKFDWQYSYSQPLDYLSWQRTGYDKVTRYIIGTLVGKNGNGKTTMKDSRFVYDPSTKSGLTIYNITQADEGWYQVLINFKNSHDVFFDSTYLIIATHPYNTTILPATDVIVFENKSVTLKCYSYGKPAPLLSWYKGLHVNISLSNSSKYHITAKHVGMHGNDTIVQGELLIMNATIQDADEYKCEARSQLGNHFSSRTLIVYYAPRNTSINATTNPVRVGQSTRITCRSSSLTLVHYHVYFNHALIYNNTNGTFDIKVVENYHEGEYACVPNNMVGVSSRSSFMLHVEVPPLLVSNNDPVTTTEGQTAQLTCTFSGDSPLNITWNQIGVAGGMSGSTTTERVLIHNSTYVVKESTALIPYVTMNAYGIYKCLAYNSYDIASSNVSLMVLDAVNITSHNFIDNGTEILLYGKQVTKECVVGGFPKNMTIVWTLNNKLVRPESIRNNIVEETSYFVRIRSQMILSFARKEDSGLLKCFAYNELANDSVTTTLNVKYPPTFSSQPNSNEYVNLESTLELSCVALANELASVSWYHGTTKLAPSTTITINAVKNPSNFQTISTLKVYPVAMDMQGVYTCSANNSLGEKNFSTKVHVYYPAKITKHPQQVTHAKNGMLNFQFQCVSTGNPPPAISWFHNGVAFASGHHNTTIQSMRNGTLIDEILQIGVVNRSHYGNWSCRTENTIANGQQMTDSKRFLLIVNFTPIFTPHLLQSSYIANETSAITFKCRVTGSPKPHIAWVLPRGKTHRHATASTTILDDHEYSVVESSLKIANVNQTDAGHYTCFANNSIGAVNATTKFIVQFAPYGNTTQKIDLHSGKVLVLSSSVISNPAPTHTFLINERIIPPSWFSNVSVLAVRQTDDITEHMVVAKQQNIIFNSSGLYQLKSCNLIGCRKDSWNVYVNYIPLLLSSFPDSVHANASNTLTFKCTFQVYPITSPLITWTQGGKNLTNTAKTHVNETSMKTSEYHYVVTSLLMVRNVTFSDSGDVMCHARNGIGENNQTFNISIFYQPLNAVNLTHLNITLNGNSRFNISITIISNPKSTFTWYKAGQPVLTSNQPAPNDSSYQQIVTASTSPYRYTQTVELLRPVANKNLSGVYEMESCNAYGCVRSNLLDVVVLYKPIHQHINASPAVETHSANITCTVEGLPLPNIAWYLEGQLLLNDSISYRMEETRVIGRYSSHVTSKLTVVKVEQSKHVGVFTCRAENLIGRSERNVSLPFHYLPLQIFISNNITTTLYKSISLTYTVQSNPASTFIWMKNGVQINHTFITTTLVHKTDSQAIETSVLSIPAQNVTRSFSGLYTVIARNPVGNTTYKFAVVIKYPPVIISEIGHETILNKGTVPSLLFTVDSNPRPTIQWFRSNALLNGGSENTHIVINNTYMQNDGFATVIRSNITFIKLDKTFSGYYNINAVNSLGKEMKQLHIIVYYAPIIIPQSRSYNVTEYTLEKLGCNVDSNPVATTLWFISHDNGVSYAPVTGDVSITYKNSPKKEYEVVYNSSLLFRPHNIEYTDFGLYYCKATNILGSSEGYQSVNVFWRPRMKITQQIHHHSNIPVVNATIQYTCTARSNPISTIGWLKDGQPYTVSSTRTVSITQHKSVMESVIFVRNITMADSANYTCHAKNRIGSNSEHDLLKVYYAPVMQSIDGNFTLRQGESALLHCTSKGYPQPTPNWYRDGIILNKTDAVLNVTYSKSLENKLLHVYTCRPANEMGASDNVSYKVFIHAVPVITKEAKCASLSRDLTKCTCDGQSLSSLSIYWTRLGGTDILSNTSTLNLPASIANDGTYICHVRNEVGESPSQVAVARFAAQTSPWKGWSVCNKTCDQGYRYRLRTCNISPCRGLTLNETVSCIGVCKVFPMMKGETDDGYIAIYVLVPFGLVVLILLCLWLARSNVRVIVSE